MKKIPTTSRALLGVMGALLTASLLAGCTAGSSSPSASTGSTLRTALSADPAPLDPATYYEGDGLPIMTATYEGLLGYAPDSAELVPALASSWEVSPDGLTYTFRLAEGVKFSDGTSLDSAAIKASFERYIDMQGGPSYMLADVASMETPDASTFVITLGQPVAPFLDYLASPYGPVAVSPTAVSEHAVDDDLAAGWLGANSAGTGPYVLSQVVKGSRYVLTANPHYRGEEPAYSTVNFAVVPDFSTQSLQLQSGDLDLLLRGLSTKDYERIAANSELQVQNFATLAKTQVWVNPDSTVFGDLAMRQALKSSLDTQALTGQVYGDRATASTQFFPNSMLADGAVADEWTADPSALSAAVESGTGGDVVVGYAGDATLQEMANALQVQLQDAGINATVREYNPAQLFALPTDPTQRPDLLVAAMNPDAAHIDTWISVYSKTAAPVNFLGCSVPEADALADVALNTPDVTASQDLYAQAGALYRDSLCWINVADIKDTIAASRVVTDMRHELPWVVTVDLGALKPEGN